MNKLLIINLDDVAALSIDISTGSLTIMAGGATANLTMPDKILLLKDGKAICTFIPDIDADELMDVISPIKP
jgi:dihydroorotase-like cyclic amidohydrolase